MVSFLISIFCKGSRTKEKYSNNYIVYLEDNNTTTPNPPRGATEPTSDTVVDEEIGAF